MNEEKVAIAKILRRLVILIWYYKVYVIAWVAVVLARVKLVIVKVVH